MEARNKLKELALAAATLFLTLSHQLAAVSVVFLDNLVELVQALVATVVQVAAHQAMRLHQ
jgi:hypothetical protein